MESLNWTIGVIEIVLYVALLLFIVSTVYLIIVVKKSNYKLIKDAVTNPVLPNIDLGFFKNLQNEYLLIRKNKIPALTNRLSFFILVFGFFLLLILVVVQELSTY